MMFPHNKTLTVPVAETLWRLAQTGHRGAFFSTAREVGLPPSEISMWWNTYMRRLKEQAA